MHSGLGTKSHGMWLKLLEAPFGHLRNSGSPETTLSVVELTQESLRLIFDYSLVKSFDVTGTPLRMGD